MTPPGTGADRAPRRVRGVGMRRELELFVPLAALVLVGLTIATLLIHRDAVLDLRDERRDQAVRAVDRLVSDLAAGGAVDATLQRHARGEEVGLLVVEPDGRPLWSAGRLPVDEPLSPLGAESGASGGLEGAGVTVLGPDRRTQGRVVVLAPIELGGRPVTVRRDEPARRLAGLLGALPILTVTVLGASVALLILVGLYVRHLLRPFDLLLDRARRVEGAPVDDRDDVAAILRSFDRALAVLEERGSDESDLVALERTLTHLDSGLLLLDAEGRLIALNDSGRRLLGLGEELEGGDLDDALAAHPELRRRLLQALAEESPVQRAEITLASPPGAEDRIVGLTLNPLRRDDGRLRGWIGLFADLTEARRAARSRQLGESLHQVGELTAGLAHELRNGLASVRGYLTLIERDRGAGGEDLARDLAELRREVDDLHRVTEDFLDFARPGNIRAERLQPERLAHRAAADPALSDAAVRVEATAEVGELEAYGDPHLLGRALRNLVDNAVRAHREAGVEQPVRLLVEGGGALRFRVVDRGAGLSPAVRDRLFVPFATARAGGSGLGLAVAQRIARLHGGEVTVREPPEGGVEAVLALPADEGTRERSPANGTRGR